VLLLAGRREWTDEMDFPSGWQDDDIWAP